MIIERFFLQEGLDKSDDVFDYESAVPEFERCVDYYKAFECENNLKFSLWEGGHTFSDDNDGFDFILNF